MSAHVISHRRPRRKCGGWGGFLLRRFGALVVTIAALGAASWVAPYFYRPPAPAPAPLAKLALTPPPADLKSPPPVDIAKTIDRSAALQMQAQRPRRNRRGIALDARADHGGADFEVLSAAELDAISQAPE